MNLSPKALAAAFAYKFGIVHEAYILKSWLMPTAADVRAFKDVGRGRRCFIMGNGPSLKMIDPRPLAGEVTFGTNAIYLVKDWLCFLPTYHVTEDTLVIEDRGTEISQLEGPVKFYSRKYVRQIPPYGRVAHPNIIYDYSEYKNFPAFSRDASRCLWTGGTVSYLCLQLAYYMGFDEVILIGFDHNYVRPTHVTAEGTRWTSHGDDPNHIHPDYFGKGKRWHDPRTDRMEAAYIRAKAEFDRVGRRVLNATIGGKLEVFPRVDYGALFPSGGTKTAPA